MGLAERRAIKAFETSTYPKLKKEIDEAAHFEVTVEIDWNTLAVEGYAEKYEEFFPQVYFTPLTTALGAITVDEMGQEALKSSLKKIVIRNTTGCTTYNDWANFENGVLTLEQRPECNVYETAYRAEALQRELESKL